MQSNNPRELPEFARQWAKQWKDAGPRLQAIRDQELRQLSAAPAAGKPDLALLTYDRYPEQNGLVKMQRWFQRQAILSALGIGGIQ